jgi:hypothetical protein
MGLKYAKKDSCAWQTSTGEDLMSKLPIERG